MSVTSHRDAYSLGVLFQRRRIAVYQEEVVQQGEPGACEFVRLNLFLSCYGLTAVEKGSDRTPYLIVNK